MDILKTVWPFFAALIGFVVWLIRLESKTIYNNKIIDSIIKDIERMEDSSKKEYDKMYNKLDEIQKMISELCVSIARVEGDKK